MRHSVRPTLRRQPMRLVIGPCLALSIAATGCANLQDFGRATDAGDAAAEADADAARQPDQDGVEIGELPPQELRAGECGLFLWTKARPPKLVFFYSGAERPAQIVIDGERLSLERTRVDGAEFYRQYERQTFTAPEGRLEVKLSVERGAEMVDGAVVPQGALRVREEGGWEVVAPVGGMVACEY